MRNLILRYHANGVSVSEKPAPDASETYLGFHSYDGAADSLAQENLQPQEIEVVRDKIEHINELENWRRLIELKLLSKKLYEMGDFVEAQTPAVKADIAAELRDAAHFLLHKARLEDG